MLVLSHVNYVKVIFGLMTFIIVLLAILMNLFEKYLPDSIRQSFRFGKMSFKGRHSKLVSLTEVPKSYFQHFYLYSSTLMLWMLGSTLYIYVFHVQVPDSFNQFLDKIGGVHRVTRVLPMHVIIAQFLLTTQCIRRFYDTNFVSIFSKHSKINLSHYLAGYIHYTGCAFAILFEAPLFSNDIAAQSTRLNIQDLSKWDIIAIATFLVACYQQFKVTVILGNLRRDSKGKVCTDKHKLPEGGLFDYLSSPHMSCEIVMYTALTIILWGNTTWLYIYAWVLSNQIEVILLNHWWYQKTFTDFPSQRKALVPMIY